MQVSIALDPRLQLEAVVMALAFALMVLGHYLPYKGWIKPPWTYVYGLGAILLCSWYVLLTGPYTGLQALWLVFRVTVAAGIATILCHDIDGRMAARKRQAETEMQLQLERESE